MADNSNLDPEVVRAFSEALTAATRELDPKVQADKLAAQQAKELEKAMGDLKKQVKESAVGLVKLTASAKDGSAKYSDAIEGATGALGKMAQMAIPFTLLGKAVGGVINIFGQLASASLKQNDALMKTYQDLSKFGANSSASLEELKDNLHRAGFSIEGNAEQMVNALKKVSPELAMFGGAAGEGAKKLTKVFNYTLKETERSLARFGYTTEEMFEYTASTVAQQSMTGAARLKTEKQLNAESVSYMQTLAELSMLTGLQRDEIDKNRRAQENDLRWQWTLRKLETSGKKEDFEQAQKMRLTNDVMLSQSKEASEGYKSIMVNQGRVVDEFAAGLQFMIGPDGVQILAESSKRAGDGVLNLSDVLKELSPRINRSLTYMEQNFLTGNDNMKGVFDGMGGFKLMLLGEATDRQKIEEQIRKTLEKGNNDRIEDNMNRKQNERKLNFTMEDMTFSVGNLVVPAMTKLTNITNIVASTFAKLVKGLTGGLVDYTKEFKTAADITEDAKKGWKDFQETGKKLAELEEKKKKAAEGSEEFKKLTSQISELKGSRKGIAESLAQANERRQQLGGSAMFSQTAMGQISEALKYGTAQASTNNAGNKTSIQELDDLFDFSDPFAKDRFHALDAGLAQKLVAAAQDYKQSTNGKKLQINSTLRTTQEQADLYAKYLKGGTVAAPPGNSKHEQGRAVDIQQGKTDSEAIRILNSHGLYQKVKGDEVHFEGAYNGGIFRGPKSGYWTKLHGTEAVLNEKQMAAISNNITKAAIPGGSGVNTASSDMKDFLIAVIEKLDELVDLQNKTARASEEHLQHAKTN